LSEVGGGGVPRAPFSSSLSPVLVAATVEEEATAAENEEAAAEAPVTPGGTTAKVIKQFSSNEVTDQMYVYLHFRRVRQLQLLGGTVSAPITLHVEQDSSRHWKTLFSFTFHSLSLKFQSFCHTFSSSHSVALLNKTSPQEDGFDQLSPFYPTPGGPLSERAKSAHLDLLLPRGVSNDRALE